MTLTEAILIFFGGVIALVLVTKYVRISSGGSTDGGSGWFDGDSDGGGDGGD